MILALVAIHIEESARAVPLGPAMLASVLKRAFPLDVDARVVDLYASQDPAHCAGAILALDPQAVGFSMYVWNRTLALETARLLKEARPGLVIFAGGPEATADLARVRLEPSLDFVLPGEGETVIVEAVAALLRGERHPAPPPCPVQDLATLPSPYLDGTLDPRQYRGVLWELSRGCPFACDFCFESRGAPGIRRIPLERVRAELERFEACGVTEAFVLDPTFNYDKAGAKGILRLIASKAPGIHFCFEIRSEFVDKEMARLFAAIPCSLQIGLQSAHDAVLRRINRRIDRAAFERKILLLHEAGATYGFDLIYGLPGDSYEGFLESLDFTLGLVPNHVDVFRLSVLPGTRLAETASSLGLRHQEHHPYQVLGSPTFPPGDLDRADRLARSVDLLYNHGKAVPWFDLLLAALEMPASKVFEAFADHLETGAGEDLLVLQTGFFMALFEGEGLAAEGRVAADLITWFGLGAGILDGEFPSACGSFHHDPRLLLDQLASGLTALEDLARVLPRHPCSATLALEDGEVVLLPH